MSDEESYRSWLSSRERAWEGLCRHCGACCGAFEDPCENLVMTPEGRSYCGVYDRRFGLRKTVSGHIFTCVSIREKTGGSWPGDERCGYKKNSTDC